MIRALLTIATLAVAACSQVETQVDAYSSIPADLAPRTVFIAPYEQADAESLEWRTNAGILGGILNEKGYQVVSRPQDARLLASFTYLVSEGDVVQTSYAIPQYGVTGYSGSTTSGTVYGNSYTANTTYRNTYGVTGYIPATRTEVVYALGAAIKMFDNANQRMVFEGTAVSVGTCFSFSAIAPQILSSMLTNFPQGKTGKVTLEGNADC